MFPSDTLVNDYRTRSLEYMDKRQTCPIGRDTHVPKEALTLAFIAPQWYRHLRPNKEMTFN